MPPCNNIWASTDGENWELKAVNARFPSSSYSSLVYNDSIRIEAQNEIFVSADGENWQKEPIDLYEDSYVDDILEIGSRPVVIAKVLSFSPMFYTLSDDNVWNKVSSRNSLPYMMGGAGKFFTHDELLWVFDGSSKRIYRLW